MNRPLTLKTFTEDLAISLALAIIILSRLNYEQSTDLTQRIFILIIGWAFVNVGLFITLYIINKKVTF